MEEIKITTEVPARKVTKTIYSCPICGVQIVKKNEASYHYGLTHSFKGNRKITGIEDVREIWYFDSKADALEFWKGQSRRVTATLPKEFWSGPGWYFVHYGTVSSYGYGYMLRSVRTLVDLYGKEIENRTSAVLTLSDIMEIVP